MDPADRKAIYSQSFESIPQFTPPAFVSVDTAFSLIDVSLFCQLVHYKDAHPGAHSRGVASSSRRTRCRGKEHAREPSQVGDFSALVLCGCPQCRKEGLSQPFKYAGS